MLPEDFKGFDCLRINYTVKYLPGNNQRLLRIIPDILVPESLMNYRTPSSAVYSELLKSDQLDRYTLVNFEDMDKTKKLMMKLDIELAITGPFELELK